MAASPRSTSTAPTSRGTASTARPAVRAARSTTRATASCRWPRTAADGSAVGDDEVERGHHAQVIRGIEAGVVVVLEADDRVGRRDAGIVGGEDEVDAIPRILLGALHEDDRRGG